MQLASEKRCSNSRKKKLEPSRKKMTRPLIVIQPRLLSILLPYLRIFDPFRKATPIRNGMQETETVWLLAAFEITFSDKWSRRGKLTLHNSTWPTLLEKKSEVLEEERNSSGDHSAENKTATSRLLLQLNWRSNLEFGKRNSFRNISLVQLPFSNHYFRFSRDSFCKEMQIKLQNFRLLNILVGLKWTL